MICEPVLPGEPEHLLESTWLAIVWINAFVGLLPGRFCSGGGELGAMVLTCENLAPLSPEDT